MEAQARRPGGAGRDRKAGTYACADGVIFSIFGATTPNKHTPITLYAKITHNDELLWTTASARVAEREKCTELKLPGRGIALRGRHALVAAPDLVMSRDCRDALCAREEPKDVAFARSTRRVRRFAFAHARSVEHAELGAEMRVLEARSLGTQKIRRLTWPSPRLRAEKSALGSEHLVTVSFPAGTASVRLDWETSILTDSIAIRIPRSARELPEYALGNCHAVHRIDFEDGARLDRLGQSALAGTALVEFVAPPSLREVGDFAFARCECLERVLLGPGVALVAENAFFGCPCVQVVREAHLNKCDGYVTDLKSVKRVALPESTTVIGESQFAGSSIGEVLVPAGVREVKDWAFNGCKCLRSVEFASSSELELLGAGAFQDSGLRAFRAPERLREIGPYAFRMCGDLASVKLGASLEALGAECFADSRLEEV